MHIVRGIAIIAPSADGMQPMTDYPGLAWLARYRERVNADPELAVIGDWFTTTFALTFGEQRYALAVEKGRIVDIISHPDSTCARCSAFERRSRSGASS